LTSYSQQVKERRKKKNEYNHGYYSIKNLFSYFIRISQNKILIFLSSSQSRSDMRSTNFENIDIQSLFRYEEEEKNRQGQEANNNLSQKK
jgi:hypothetical protein